ncbi:MAG: DNA-binding protein [Clostridiales bacterium]|nr:DNA-binding protein [Candidatus Apopatocola equi]MCQ2439951.1 DNA-binding protein [Oscillospiraceae bacterium]
MDEQIELTMLFDFYGELLTKKQQEYFRLHRMEDLSLSEIAESESISRQGVWDNIRRAEETLRRSEEKFGLLGRYLRQQAAAEALERDTQELLTLTTGRARELAENIRRRVQELQHGI